MMETFQSSIFNSSQQKLSDRQSELYSSIASKKNDHENFRKTYTLVCCCSSVFSVSGDSKISTESE